MSSAQASPAASTSGDAVIALDFGGTKIDVALAHPSGAVLERIRLDTLADRGPQQALARAAQTAGILRERAVSAHGCEVVAHAAVGPGVIQRDRVLLAPNMPGWEALAFARSLADELGLAELDVCNDVRAGALAELRFGSLRDADPAIYVSLGTGLAAALIVGGAVVAGAHGAAGEIGYTTLDRAGDVVPGAAPLEELVGGRALGARASDALGGRIEPADLFARTDPAATALVRHALDALGGALANLAVFVDPRRIAIGGGMMADAQTILPVLRARLAQGVPFAPEVVAARFARDASLYGAIALALDARDAALDRSRIPGSPATADGDELTGAPR